MSDINFITLDNGLTVLMYSDKTKITNHVELLTFIGGNTAKYVDKNNNIKKIKPGTAHLLEHYICENTVSGNLVDNLYKYKVLDSNASTNSERTSIHFDTVYNFKECLEVFLEGIYNIDFSPDKLEKTKYAVYNEIRDSKDSAERKIYRAKSKGIFKTTANTLGNKTSIDSIGSKYLKDVYESFYVPKNQFLVIAGSAGEEEILDQVKKFYSKCTFTSNKKALPIEEIDEVVKNYSSVQGDNLDEIIISYKIKTDDKSNFDKYKLDWYLGYFCDINFSRYSTLNEKLKQEEIITGDINCCTYIKNGYTVLEVVAYTNKKAVFVREVENVIKNYQNSKKEFELRKKESILRLSVRKDSISNYVIPVMDNYVDFDYPHNDTIDFVNSLNYEEYQSIISKIDFSNINILDVKKNTIN